MLPTISVLMSVYNGGSRVKAAIDSILGQTFRDLELIVIDDASTDKTPKVLAAFEDPRLRLFRNSSNVGLTRSLNRAIAVARAPLLARQDADDTSHPERLSIQHQFLESHPDVGLLGTYAELVGETGLVIKSWTMPTEHENIVATLHRRNAFCHGSVMMRRAELEKVGAYREKFRYAQDYELWLRMMEVTQVHNVSDFLYFMYRGKSTITTRHLSEQVDYKIAARELARERQKAGSDQYDQLPSGEPAEWLCKHFVLSETAVLQEKRSVFLGYFREMLVRREIGSALKLRWRIFRSFRQQDRLITLTTDVLSSFRIFLSGYKRGARRT